MFSTYFLKGFYEENKIENKTGCGKIATVISTYCSQVPDLLAAKPFIESFLFQDIRQKSQTS